MATGPTRDVKEFQFKVAGQLRVFSAKDKLDIETPVKLVSTSNKYGLIFVGVSSGLISIISSSIVNNPEIKNKALVITSNFPRRYFPLPSQPSHVDVSADGELVAVAIRIQNIPVLQIYSATSFGSQNVCKKVEMRMSNTAGVKVADMQWNPGIHNIISAVMTDGSVVLYEIKDSSFTLNSLPPTTQAKCFCWSPKGKQLVIGSADGSLTQYKPDLKQVKSFPPPSPSASIISVHWLSSFQFVAAYVNTTVPYDRPAIVVVNVPKGAQVSYVRYDDVCFGSLSKRPEYYFIHQQIWNILVIGCGDSMELSVLGLEPNSVNWVHWKQDDATRAELPLNEEKDDVHNLGIALDISPTQPIQLNDSLSVGPMPIVVALSHDGVLSFFTALNLLPGAPSVCSAPQQFSDQSGLQLFISPIPQQVATQGSAPLLPTTAQPSFGQPSISSVPVAPQSSSTFPFVSSSSQNIPQTTTNIFSQSASSFATSAFGQSPSFRSAAPITNQTPSTQASPLFSATSFGQSSLMFSKTPSVFQSLTPPVSQATPPVSQVAVAPAAPNATMAITQSATQPTTAVSMAPSMAAISTTSSSSFGSVIQPSNQSIGFPKTSTSTSPKFSFSFDGVKAESTPSVTKDQNIVVETKSVKPETVNAPGGNTASPDNKLTEEKADTTEIDNAAYMAAIQDELMSFQDEFSGVKQYLSNFKVKVAEEKVKGEISSKVDGYHEFTNELVDTTQAQTTEVSSLKISLLDILSWIQLIKTKQYISTNQSLIEMREAEEMDPIGKHWCKRIEQQLYGLQFQVKQAVEQIETLKNSDKEGGLYPPTFEAVLQILINQTKIVMSQKATLTKLEDKLAEKVSQFQRRKKKIIQPDLRVRNKMLNNESQLSMLAHKLLYTKLESSDDSLYSYRETSEKMIAKEGKRKGRLDPFKDQLLRQWLKNHKTIYSKVALRQSSLQNLNLSCSLKPTAKSTDKKIVSFTNAQMESPDTVVVKPVPTTPLGRTEIKSGQLNRNLFATPSDSTSVGSGVTPLVQDKVLYRTSLLSNPIPSNVVKDAVKINIASPALTSSSKLSPNTQLSIVTTSAPLTSKASSLPFGSASATITSVSSTSPSINKIIPTKLAENLPKPVDQVPKVISFSSPSNPVFNFGVFTNKENTTLNSQVVAPSVSTPLFTKPASKANLTVGGLNPSSEIKPLVEEANSSLAFNFNSMSQSLKTQNAGTLSVENSSTPKIDSVSSAAPVQPFSFGTSNKSTSESAAPAVVTSAPLFPFSSIALNASTPQSTAAVGTTVNPLTSFSFSSVSYLKNPAPVISSVTSANPGLPTVPSALTVSSVNNTVPPAPTLSSSASPVITSSASPSSETPKTVSSVSSQSLPVTSSSITPQVSNSTTKSSVTPSPLFGAPAITSTVSTPVTTSTVTTTSSAIFNSSQISFGSPSFKPASTSAPAFGSSAFGSFTPATSASSIFGAGALKFSSNNTNTPAVFGQPVSTGATAPLFNQVATTTSPFGQTITSTQTPSSPFNQTTPVQSTASSPFSQATTTFSATTASFGTSTFGSAPVFSSLSNTSFGGGPTFGAATTAPSVFGSPSTTTTASSLFNTPLFGQTTQATSSPFGSIPGQTSPFSTASPSTQVPSSPFGATNPQANPFFNQSQSSVFGQTSSGGSFGSSGGSMFGGSSSFGSSPQGGQFQSSGGNIFGGGNSGGPFSAGGGQTVGQAGFGAPPSFQSSKPGSGAFGSAPVFGSSPSFGGAPAFGSSPTFGSPNKAFGSTSPVAPGGGFGGQGNMFENIANQNTMTFGNLAQAQPQAMPSTFGTPPPQQQTGSSFGGNAFSSWR